MSRILEYRRINLASIAKVNIKGTAVEPVIHAAAELLDNATRYSPPAAKVHVTATEVQSGVCIEIEDAGVSLSEESRGRIEGLLEQAKRGTDVQDLAHHPRLGLSVVGRLCTQFGMDVSLRASAYGGVRAILIVPSKMMTTEPGVGLAHGIGATSIPTPGPDALPGPERKPKKRRPTSPRIPATVSLEDDVPEVTEWTAGGLPQRRSRVKMPLSQRLAEQARGSGRTPNARPGRPPSAPATASRRPRSRNPRRTRTRAASRPATSSAPSGRGSSSTRAARAPTRSPAATSRPTPRQTTRGTSSDRAARQVRLDAPGPLRRRPGHRDDRGALRRRPAHRPLLRGPGRADRVAAACAGLQSLASAVSQEIPTSDGDMKMVLIEMNGGYFYLMAAGPNAYLAVLSASAANPAGWA